ncbi:hypothetical protein SLEP1_g48590 [Rubroshorea leprosula]|uniref:RRM domain-containing protein n=1 Tax=Rubroshorea leprosula TaxID=152421 RepID=A0AAV5LV88_9ROSI|nr:hypothetical protein SLEP1_g48590 [Rubroshorea leprosula]
MRERESARVRARFSTAKDSGAWRWLLGFGKGLLEQATTFFFYDFPEDRLAKDLWFCFWSYGKVVDVFIPTRRDRRGRQFGFVRMSSAFDVKDMERRLNQIWLDSYCLKVKLAENMKKGKDETRVAQNRREEKQWVRRDRKVSPRRSYAQAVAANLGVIVDGLSSNNGVRQLMAMRGMEEIVDAVPLEGLSLKASAVVPKTTPEKITVPLITEGVAGATSPMHGDLVLEFNPRDEEVAWLNRSMVAVVRSLDMVGSKAYPIEVAEEEWRMDPDWWLAGERRNPISESNFKYSSDDGSESDLIATGFRGEDEALKADLQVVTGSESFENFEINGMEICGLDGADLVGPEGEDLFGPEGVDLVGLAAMKNGEQRAAGGSCSGLMASDDLLQQQEVKQKKKTRALGAIYAEDEGIGAIVDGKEKLRAVEASWVTARTKSMRDRRSKASREESRLEVQTVGYAGRGRRGQFQGDITWWICIAKVEGHGFIGISAEWGKQQLQCTFVNVYAPCERQSRVVLWGELSKLVLEEGGRWLLAGDFNAIRNSVERERKDGPDGTSMSRLDRFLLSIEMSLIEGDWIQEVIRRLFGNVKIRSDNLRKEIERLDKKCEVEGLNEIEVKLRKESFQELWDTLQKRESVWKQKSRVNWAHLGDANTAFFHRSVHARRAQNAISSIYSDEGWVEEPELVKATAVKYFSKVLVKVLANRLKMIMEGIISESQAAFIGGRQLVDSVLVLNEAMHEGFLDWMMNRMGFGMKWRKWMWECLSTTRISILINGSPTTEFPVSNGLRQGDPLSPFLFLLVAEGLSGLVKKAEAEGLLKGVEIRRGGMMLSLLQFADDTVFMGKADVDNLRVVKAILNWFQLISGLKINFGKSYLYGFNVSEGWEKDFWHDKWVGDKPLKNIFPRLYALANSREGRLKDMGYWSAENWIWDCRWRRGCVGRGVGEEEQFRELINKVKLHRGEVDSWRWIHSGDSVYSAKKAYDFLSPKCFILDEKWSRVIWEGNVCCGLCHEGVEQLQHIFCDCKEVWLVWMKVLGWWGVQSVLPKDIFGLADAVVAGINGGSWTDLGPLIFLVTAWNKAAVSPIQIGFYDCWSARRPLFNMAGI